MCVCVCACVRACVRAVYAREYICTSMPTCLCARAYTDSIFPLLRIYAFTMILGFALVEHQPNNFITITWVDDVGGIHSIKNTTLNRSPLECVHQSMQQVSMNISYTKESLTNSPLPKSSHTAAESPSGRSFGLSVSLF